MLDSPYHRFQTKLHIQQITGMARRGLEWGGKVIKRRREGKQLKKKGRKDGCRRGGGERGNGENNYWVTPGQGGKRHTDHVRKGTGGKA